MLLWVHWLRLCGTGSNRCERDEQNREDVRYRGEFHSTGVVGVFGAVKRTRFLISDSSSRIAALARFPTLEQQICRELSPIKPTGRSTQPYDLGRGVGRILGVGPPLGVGVGLGVAVADGVDVAVAVAVAVALGVAAIVAVGVAVAVAVAVGVKVAVAVGVKAGVAVAVAVAVGVDEAVGVGVGVPPPDGDTRT